MKVYQPTRRVLLSTALLVAAAGLHAAGAHAQVSTCRSDPMLVLTNGKSLQLTATISDTQSDVSKVVYSVNIPSGVAVSSISYTQGWKSGAEQVVLQSANTAGNYTTNTTVYTGKSGMSFTATDSLLSGSSTLATGTGSGTSVASGSSKSKGPTVTLKG